jgi:heptosyltransferase-2
MKVSINGSFDVPQELQDWASSEIPKKSIAVFLGGSIILRRLSIEQLMSAVTQVLKEDEHVILLGGLDVDSTARQIVRQINDPRILNFVGTVSLIQSAALIQRSQRFVGPDSGLMHLACALNVPVIAIFGPGNIKKWAPRSESRFRIVSKYLPCSPCTNFGYTIPTCKGSYGCLKNLTIN